MRERWPDIALQVDANTAYSLADEHVAALKSLDAFDLLLVEQPLPEDDVRRPCGARAADLDADLPR